MARLGGFHAAARQLQVTQPVVSARIRELERLLGVDLFERVARRVHLTARGRELVPFAERSLEISGEIHNRIANTSSMSGLVRLGTTSTPAHSWLPQFMRSLADRYPLIEVELCIASSDSMWRQVQTGELHLAVVGGWLEGGHVKTEPFQLTPMAWFASPSLGLPGRALDPVELCNWPLVLDDRGTQLNGLAMRWFEAGGAVPRRVHSCPTLITRVHLTAEGLGIGLLPPAAAAPGVLEGRLVPVQTIDAVGDLEYVIAYSEANYSPVVRIVMEEIKRAAQSG